MKQFSATKARRLAELLCDANLFVVAGNHALSLPEGVEGEVVKILAEYKEGIGGEVTES